MLPLTKGHHQENQEGGWHKIRQNLGGRGRFTSKRCFGDRSFRLPRPKNDRPLSSGIYSSTAF